MNAQERADRAMRHLHSQACPGCGCEPEVEAYFRDKDGAAVGYRCVCGVTVIRGVVQ